MVKLPLGFIWNIYGYYTDRQLTIQGQIAALGTVGSSLSYSGYKNRLKFSLSIENITNSINERTILNTMKVHYRAIVPLSCLLWITVLHSQAMWNGDTSSK